MDSVFHALQVPVSRIHAVYRGLAAEGLAVFSLSGLPRGGPSSGVRTEISSKVATRSCHPQFLAREFSDVERGRQVREEVGHVENFYRLAGQTPQSR
ncbi:hypothetical protein KM043_003591 [Ampulex compressa]|nr:hypothetical protein KM043_003591 [Ampulex compressa]